MMLRVLYIVMLCCALGETNAIAGENPDYLNLLQRARAEYRSGHFAASEPLFLAALRTLDPADQLERAATVSQLGDVYVNQDDLPNAERAYEESLAIFKRLSHKNGTAVALRNLGSLYSLQWRNDDAIRVLQQALKLTKAAPAAEAGLTVQVLNSLGVVYFRQGKKSKAESFFNQALRMVEISGVPFDTALLLNNLGAVYFAKRKFQQAEDLLKQSLKAVEMQLGSVHPDLTFTLAALGVLYTDTGRYAEAEDQYQRALKILEPGKLDFDTRNARLLHALSVTYAKASRKAEAEAALVQAAVIARRNLRQHPDMVAIVEAYASHLRTRGKTKEAEELRAETVRARVTAGLVINAHSAF